MTYLLYSLQIAKSKLKDLWNIRFIFYLECVSALNRFFTSLLDDYPETIKLLNDSFVVCSEPYPIYAQKLELIKYYAEAFHKVFDNIEEVVEAGALL